MTTGENNELKWILKMDGGDGTFCNQARRSEVALFNSNMIPFFY
jgi:hypothetical protein